jgi:uncharacterized membrane protein
MDVGQLFWLAVASRCLHVGTAIVLVGGAFFMRFVLAQSAHQSLEEPAHTRLRGALLSRWKLFVHAGITLLLVTGGYNYLRVILEGSHKGDSLYHALLGTKILLAMGIFFIASVLVGRAPAFESMRARARLWLVVNLLLALGIVGISGFLKVRGTAGARAPRASAAAASRDRLTLRSEEPKAARTRTALAVS